MVEKILDIQEFGNKYGDGYKIITNKQTIMFTIGGGQQCCENWGYFMSEDDLEQFVGANIIDISLTDTCLNTEKYNGLDLFQPDLMFVNINTSKGTLQFTAYNAHNGYYGHEARVVSEQLIHTEIL